MDVGEATVRKANDTRKVRGRSLFRAALSEKRGRARGDDKRKRKKKRNMFKTAHPQYVTVYPKALSKVW